jgi:hypothetical protein
MRKLLFIMILSSIISCVNDRKDDKPIILVRANVIRSYDSVLSDNIKHKTFDIKLSITNKMDKPVSFWMMTCSWQENFLISNDYIYFIGSVCDTNSLWPRHLHPDDSFTYKTSVAKFNSTPYQTIKTTRFGLIYIDTLKCKYPGDYRDIIGDKSQWANIIWSNPLYLNNFK